MADRADYGTPTGDPGADSRAMDTPQASDRPEHANHPHPKRRRA